MGHRHEERLQLFRLQMTFTVLHGVENFRAAFEELKPVPQCIRRFLRLCDQERSPRMSFVRVYPELAEGLRMTGEKVARQERFRRFVRCTGYRQIALFFEEGGKVAVGILAKEEGREHEY